MPEDDASEDEDGNAHPGQSQHSRILATEGVAELLKLWYDFRLCVGMGNASSPGPGNLGTTWEQLRPNTDEREGAGPTRKQDESTS